MTPKHGGNTSDTKLERETVATCLVCGNRINTKSKDFYAWCGKHGVDGSEHGLLDIVLRLLGIRTSTQPVVKGEAHDD